MKIIQTVINFNCRRAHGVRVNGVGRSDVLSVILYFYMEMNYFFKIRYNRYRYKNLQFLVLRFGILINFFFNLIFIFSLQFLK